MKKWIRWPGLIVFVGVVLILLGFWWLLVDSLVERMIEKGGTDRIDEVVAAIESTDAIAYTARLAADEAAQAKAALEVLPESAFRKALAAVADFSVSRSF